MRWLDDIADSTDMSLSKFREIVKDPEAWHSADHEIAESGTTERLNNNKAFSTVTWLVDDFLIYWPWGNCVYGLASSFLVPFNFWF